MPLLAITLPAAEALLDHIGNNGVDSDVTLYDGGQNDYTGDTFFGFTADLRPNQIDLDELGEAIISATYMVKHYDLVTDEDTWLNQITDSSDPEVITGSVGINDGWASTQVVFWNVRLI